MHIYLKSVYLIHNTFSISQNNQKMNFYKNENSLKNASYKNKITSKSFSILNSKFIHKLFDSINFSLLILIFIFSFISFDSQRQWTIIYKNLAKIKGNNNNLIDYISKTEEFYISELENLNSLKKTTPKDLIYLDKKVSKERENFFKTKIKQIKRGLKDSRFQIGY